MTTIDPEFMALMAARPVISRYTGEDSFGNDGYATGALVVARAEPFHRSMSVRTQQSGTMVADDATDVRLIMDLTSPVYAVRDRVVLNGRTLTVVDVVVEEDENGPYYQSLQCRNNVAK